MIDFTTTQISWILIGACSIGGTGYVSMDNKISEMDKKLAVVHTKIEASEKRLSDANAQLDRIENLIIKQNKGSR
jgi:hypothetical protein